MGRINPSLFSALGKGFVDDEYAVDGNHLRWQFDPRLGFPRHACCVDVRPSVLVGRALPEEGLRFADLRVPAGGSSVTRVREVIGTLEVTRPVEGYVRTTAGARTDARPLVLRFTGADAHACWVRLTMTVASRGGAARVEAFYRNRGALELVDVASYRRRPVFDDIHDLFDRPVLASGRQFLRDAKLLALHRRLTALDPSKFSRISTGWLQQLSRKLDDLGIRPDQISPDLSIPVRIALVVSSARIDELAVTGNRASLEDVRWVRSEDLARDRRWKPIGCFPAATGEDDYVERNADLFDGRDPADLAKERALLFGPKGAEPLDEPVVPPVRPGTDEERFRRTLQPWQERLEPWLRQVLAESRGGALHQSEVTIAGDLDDAGQRRGQGIPARLAARPPTMTFRPYEVLIAAGLAAYPTARLLGLGCVHTDPGTELLDYRVRGRWLVEDLWAWVGAVQRRVQDLAARITAAPSPAVVADLQVELLHAQAELTGTVTFVASLTAGAIDGVVELVALVIGVQPARHPLFTPPAGVTVSADGLGLPPDHAREAIASVQWPLRQRARVVDDTMVPTGACIARSPAPSSGMFESVRNRNDPADPASPPVAVVPAGPAGAPGAAGTAVFSDRYVADGADLRYGVAECDPFGRWSAFAETDFRWDDLTPPAPPGQIAADLDESGTPVRQVLTVRWSWLLDNGPLASTTFELHLRRTAPPSGGAVAPAAWGRCERVDGSAAAPLSFPGTFTGATSHDGMAVQVDSADEVRTTPLGTRTYRVFTVVLDGVVVAYDAGDRARAWVAVRSVNAKGIPSDDLGGPALAEHIRVVPPPPPVFPPEPLSATYPDADRRSTFTVTWSAAPGVRSVVYRAGERDLVAMAALRGIPTAWREDDPPALRGAAVRSLAPQLRDAFRPLSAALPAGTSAYTDDLPGDLVTLTLYTTVGQSPALVPGPWPAGADGFVAVAVPRIPQPSRPMVLGAVAVPPGREVWRSWWPSLPHAAPPWRPSSCSGFGPSTWIVPTIGVACGPRAGSR
jgi:hypothetical protein